MDEPVIDYTHPTVNEMVSAIGGNYLFNQEVRIPDEKGDVLYYCGFFMIDRSCCGVGGSAYCLVVGHVVDWQYRTAANGRPVSKVRPVKDRRTREMLVDRLKKEDPLRQVAFV